MFNYGKTKKFIGILIGINIGLQILGIFTNLVLHGSNAITEDIIGLILSVVFFIFLYKGYNWARILNAFIFFGGVIGFYFIYVFYQKLVPIEVIEKIIFNTVYLVSGGLLLFSKSIKNYFKK